VVGFDVQRLELRRLATDFGEKRGLEASERSRPGGSVLEIPEELVDSGLELVERVIDLVCRCLGLSLHSGFFGYPKRKAFFVRMSTGCQATSVRESLQINVTPHLYPRIPSDDRRNALRS